MICVSIGRGRHKQMIVEHQHLVDQGAELVELRLDYIKRDVNLKRLLANRPCPVVITCRREEDGGKWEGNEEARQMLLRAAIAEGVEYVDLEEDIAEKIPRYGSTKRIISLHNFRETPDDLQGIQTRLSNLDCDIVKIATMAHNPYDNLRMLRLVRDSTVPTVGMCMGEIGTPTRILAGKFGAPFTYATFHHERSLAPGQLSFRQMKEIYHYDKINKDTEIYGVIADPVGHSMSPMIHNAAFQKLNLNKVYIPFRIPSGDLNEFLMDCQELDVKGLSVTIPHKEAVVNRLSKVDSAVNGIGAANTIIFREGDMVGFNTDCNAAMESIGAVLSNVVDDQPLAHKRVLILGAGGVARAVGFGVQRWGAEVVIASRTFARAERLANRLECKVVEWDARHEVRAALIVNGTPIGMHPNVDESPFEQKFLHPTTIVFDTVYNPEQTLLIKQAREKGCTVATGVDMFVRQAALQFKLFTQAKPPIDLMRETLIRAIGPYSRG